MIPAAATGNLIHSLTNRFGGCRFGLEQYASLHQPGVDAANLEACVDLLNAMSDILAELRPDGDKMSKRDVARILHRLAGGIGLARARIRHAIDQQGEEDARPSLQELDEYLASAGVVIADFRAEWLEESTRSLREVIARMTANAPQIEVSLSDDPAFDELAANRFVLEFIDEALVNAQKHGQPAITLSADLVDGQISIRIGDEGLGYDPAQVRRGHGMHVLEDSAAALGGELIVEAHPSTVTLRFPVE